MASAVRDAFSAGKSKKRDEMKDTALDEVQTLEENYQKVIGYGRKCIISS